MRKRALWGGGRKLAKDFHAFLHGTRSDRGQLINYRFN